MKRISLLICAVAMGLLGACSKPEIRHAAFVFQSAPGAKVREEIRTTVAYERGKDGVFSPSFGQPIHGVNGNERFQIRIRSAGGGPPIAEVLIKSGDAEHLTSVELEQGQQVVVLGFGIPLTVTPDE